LVRSECFLKIQLHCNYNDQTGKYAEAETLLKKHIKFAKQANLPKSITCGMLYSLGKVYYDSMQFDKAEKMLLEFVGLRLVAFRG